MIYDCKVVWFDTIRYTHYMYNTLHVINMYAYVLYPQGEHTEEESEDTISSLINRKMFVETQLNWRR